MKKIRAVIFDCDGVMFDSRRANNNFYNHILAHFGLPPMTEQEEAFVHMHTAEESVAQIFRNSRHVEAAQQYRLQVDYSPFIRDMILEPGLKDLLEALRPNYGLAVATNRSNTIGKVLESSGLEGYFDIVVSSVDVRNPKPHPESLFKILDFFGIKPGQGVYIGDSLVDSELCQATGVPLIAYQNRDLEACHHVETMAEVKAIFAALEKPSP